MNPGWGRGCELLHGRRRVGGMACARARGGWSSVEQARRHEEGEREVIMMQKSQFSGRLGAMRRDTPRCCAIIITTDDIIPSVDLPRKGASLRVLARSAVETDFADQGPGTDALLIGVA